MLRPRAATVLALISLALAACAPAGPAAPRDGAAPASAPSDSRKTLVAAVRVEPDSVAARPPRGGGLAALNFTRRLLNAELTLLDQRDDAQPYLAEQVPQLGTDTWVVLPDGRMETTWRLRLGSVWHDGTSLTAADFVFAWSVYSTPDFGGSSSPPLHAIEAVLAPDDRTIVIRWRRPYPDANNLAGYDRDFVPLPRQILEQPFQQLDTESFAHHPYWSREYVGLGPYRLDRWEPGSFIEAAAFDQHVLGRPRIERIKVLFVSDANTALASMLAGDVHMAADNSLNLEQVLTLRRAWETRNGGSILLVPSLWRATAFQLRPDFAAPRAVLDRRVRTALAHAVGKQAINDSVYQGEELVSEFMISPSSKWGPAVEGAIRQYSYDTRRSEELMREAGFTRASDGMFASPSEGRFRAELKTTAAPNWEAEMTIMASEWRKTGFEVQDAVLPQAQAQDAELRMTFPAMFTSTTSLGERAMLLYSIAEIPRADNRWRGGNRGAWVSPEYDRLLDAFTTTLEPRERAAQVAELARIFTEDLPVISLLFNSLPAAHVAALRGPMLVSPESLLAWNVPEWEWR
jgi:peptide/nickel transport system substrate-binding protein